MSSIASSVSNVCCATCGRPLTDELTGVLARPIWRAHLGQVLATARREARPLSLIIFDLDHFKQVNDVYGHPGGDIVLQAVADLLTAAVTDTAGAAVLGRYGEHADEFLIGLHGADLIQGHAVAENIRRNLKRLSVLVRVSQARATAVTGLTASMGLVAYDPRAPSRIDIDDLILEADVALRQAKREGRDRIRTRSVIPAWATGTALILSKNPVI